MAVAQEIGVFLPSTNLFDQQQRGTADVLTMWIEQWLPSPGSPFLPIPAGPYAAKLAMEYADRGDFVIVGATHEMINKYKEKGKQTSHGHVAVVTPGSGKNGFPRGYWGQYGKDKDGNPLSGKKDESLSLSFNKGLRNDLLYFAVMRGKTETKSRLGF
ncbi:hypothetical protein [Novosphingobium kaempferiae]|uniref:hypothetical protein n=1 Tax=Novosphingobium kaempferiae TaxID=2896849 RepID=UPI001E5E80CE|nr:hypothetical protein [Novosphingobium kaempferiae]